MSLTDEDKQWIKALLSEQVGAEERIAARNSEQLRGAEERIAARNAEQLERAEERMAARVERVETALLTEFHKWASPLEMRIRTHSAALRAIDLELEAVGEGVTKLEGQ